MKADQLKATKQYKFCLPLAEKGLSRKEIALKLMEEFSLTRRTATTYVYLWFPGDEYKVRKPKKPRKRPTKNRAPKNEEVTSEKTTKKKNDGWEF